MEDQDLREIGITDPSHRKKILHAARSLPKVTQHPLASSVSHMLLFIEMDLPGFCEIAFIE